MTLHLVWAVGICTLNGNVLNERLLQVFATVFAFMASAVGKFSVGLRSGLRA